MARHRRGRGHHAQPDGGVLEIVGRDPKDLRFRRQGAPERAISEAAIHMKRIEIHAHAGAFAENKDAARDLRLKEIIPALDKGESVVLSFERVDAVTQSFIHALISDLIRKRGVDVLDRLEFKSCNDTVKKIISIVVDYMQEGA
ncbi:MAG TPA: hypothetical protein DCM05_01635 [Elusimicrobia bacterium]|nr:hypothetical protein [Elusimicrobiota bacterium]